MNRKILNNDYDKFKILAEINAELHKNIENINERNYLRYGLLKTTTGWHSIIDKEPKFINKYYLLNTNLCLHLDGVMACVWLRNNFVNNIDVYFKAINSISNKDVRVSKRILLPGNRLRGFEVGKIGPIDNDNFVGGNYAASMNFVTQVPNLFPELQNADFNFFLDMANVWGVDYSSALDDSGSIRSALGVGVDWFTPIGPLSFSLSQPITSSNSDKKETFRFNLGTTF